MPEANKQSRRIASLDQFRGYAVLGMLLVNFLGSFEAANYLLKHHNTFCSFADTVMPQFFFAVGFAFRLTFRRRAETLGAPAAYLRVVRRLLGLMLVAVVVYSVGRRADSWERLLQLGLWEAIKDPLKSTWFQTLMHIAAASLWILPVIRARAAVRIAMMLGSAGLHVLLSHVFYFHWVNNGQPNGIDGGPLGFLTWTIPTIIGTLACDAVVRGEGRPRLLPLVLWSAALMGLGYFLSCGTRLYDVATGHGQPGPPQRLAASPALPGSSAIATARERIATHGWTRLLAEPPFVPPPHPGQDIGQSHLLRKWNYWMMSQRCGTISYLTFSAGLSLAIYLLFHVCCDICGWQLGILRTFGSNALAAYVLHMMVEHAVKQFMPRDVPAWYMGAGCVVFIGIVYVFIRSLEKNQIYIRL